MNTNGAENINDLETLLSPHIGKDERLVNYQTSRLTAPGENYGSIMLSLKVTLKNKRTGTERILETIAKLIPTNEYVKEMFNVQKTFRNEIAFYGEIIPTVKNFLNQNGLDDQIDFVADYFGGRLNINGSDGEVDNDAVLILENLKIKGYNNNNRLEGFDAGTAKSIIKELAKMHAIFLALKIKDPQAFENKVKPYLTDFHFSDEINNIIEQMLKQSLQDHPEGSKYLETALRYGTKKIDKEVNEKWATLMHNDLWVNNIMIRPNEVKADVKFVDFQNYEYKSGLRDLLFFLFSSIRKEILENHFDEFLDLYYKTFIENLKKLSVNVGDYSRKEFDKQLKSDAKMATFTQVLFMVMPILTEQKFNLENMKNIQVKSSQKQKDTVLYMTLEFFRRGWLS